MGWNIQHGLWAYISGDGQQVGPPSLVSEPLYLQAASPYQWCLLVLSLQGKPDLLHGSWGLPKAQKPKCQTFLNLRPGTGIASLWLHYTDQSVLQAQIRFSVCEGYARTWMRGRNAYGPTLGELVTEMYFVAKVDSQVSWPTAYIFCIKSMEVRSGEEWESKRDWQETSCRVILRGHRAKDL